MVYFIVNPAAGSGKALIRLKEINKYMTGKFRILTTNSPMNAKKLAKHAVSKSAKAVVAVGGDGTIQEVISGLVGTDTAFGIVPGGSGNDFIKCIGINEKMTTDKYLQIVKNANTKVIDLIKMDSFYFANIGSVGIDAEIAHTAANLKKLLGRFSYVAATLYCVVTHSPTQMHITIDGQRLNREFTLAAVCNGQNYGGGFKIAPCAINDDGLITLCLIDRLSKPAATLLFPSVLAGAHANLKQVNFTACKQVTINYPGVQRVNLDGNLYELKGPLNFEIIPHALKVLI